MRLQVLPWRNLRDVSGILSTFRQKYSWSLCYSACLLMLIISIKTILTLNATTMDLIPVYIFCRFNKISIFRYMHHAKALLVLRVSSLNVLCLSCNMAREIKHKHWFGSDLGIRFPRICNQAFYWRFIGVLRLNRIVSMAAYIKGVPKLWRQFSETWLFLCFHGGGHRKYYRVYLIALAIVCLSI